MKTPSPLFEAAIEAALYGTCCELSNAFAEWGHSTQEPTPEQAQRFINALILRNAAALPTQ